MSPPHLTVEAAAAPKWFHSPSDPDLLILLVPAAGQVPQGNCWEVVMVALLGVPQEAHL